MAKTLSELWKTGETIPGSADLVRGGLGIDIKNKRVFSKDKYDNIFEIGTEGGGLLWDFDKIYQIGTLVTIENILPGGTVLNQEYISLTNGNQGNDPLTDEINWKLYNAVKWVNKDVTITVGTGGDFTNLNDAVNFFARYSMTSDSQFYIKFINSHTINYHVTIPKLSITNGIKFISDGSTVTFDVSICNDIDGERSLIGIHTASLVRFEDIDIDILGEYNVDTIYYSPFYMKNAVFSGCTINYNATQHSSNWHTAFIASLGENTVFNFNSSTKWNMILYGQSFYKCTVNGDMKDADRLFETISSGGIVRDILGNFSNYEIGFKTQSTQGIAKVSNVDFSGALLHGIGIQQGGMVFVNDCTTTFSQTPGAITNNGMIFDNGNNIEP